MEKNIFDDFDFTDFWDDSEYAIKEYVEEYPNGELIFSVEQELGYKLPASYIQLMKLHNGGIPKNCCFPNTERTSWAEDHVAISGFFGIGRSKRYALCGSMGSQSMINDWGYPNIGVLICDTPSGGHDMIMLDYSNSALNGEPEVVHIDQESDYRKTFLAKDFETFFRGLVNDTIYDTSEQDLIRVLETIKTGNFSDILHRYFQIDRTEDFERVLRNLVTEITKEKGFFALHSDDLSYLSYDLQFYLLSASTKISSREHFLEEYPKMLVFGNNEINTGAYAQEYVKEWFNLRLQNKEIIKGIFSGYKLSNNFKLNLLEQIRPYN